MQQVKGDIMRSQFLGCPEGKYKPYHQIPVDLDKPTSLPTCALQASDPVKMQRPNGTRPNKTRLTDLPASKAGGFRHARYHSSPAGHNRSG